MNRHSIWGFVAVAFALWGICYTSYHIFNNVAMVAPALVTVVVLLALGFDFTNGIHDAANSIATVVSTKVLTPRQAVMLAAVTNLIGAFFGVAVAATISSGLGARPDDRDSLFTLCMAAGLMTDYAALVERRRFGSFFLARQTQVYVRKLLALQPPVYDAYLAMGTTEYVVGSIPFYLRWLVHIDNIEGSKKRGMEMVQLVADRGRYYGPFARILLAAGHLREKRLDEAQRLLEGVLAEYPGNPLIIKELERIAELRREAAAAGKVRARPR